MQKISKVKIKLKGNKMSKTNKIIQSFNMPLLEVVQSKRGKIVFFDNFRYTINKKLRFDLFRMFPQMWRENGRKWFTNRNCETPCATQP